MVNNNPNSRELLQTIAGCKKKKRSAQKALYRAFYSYGMSICMRYTGNREEAVEVLNDGFMKVFINIKKFNPKYPFKAWLRKILINESINTMRKKAGSFVEQSLEEAAALSSDETITSDISHQDVIAMIQQLSPQYKAVFNLHVIEGYSHEEIGEMLGISAGTSKSNLAKAKQKLRELLDEYLGTDERIRRG